MIVCICLFIVGVGICSLKFTADRRGAGERTAEVQENVQDEIKEIEALNARDNVVYAGVFDEEVTDEEESGLVAAIDNDAENVKSIGYESEYSI